MRTVVLLLCVVVAAHARPSDTCNPSDLQVATQKLRLGALQDDFTSFRDKVTTRTARGKEVDAKVRDLRIRLGFLEDSGCDDEFEMQCGGESPLCISRLLICDGFNDCPNGIEESECDVYTPSGSVWKGDIIYDHCSKRQPEHIRMTIENYRVIDYLRSFPEVTATLEFDSHLHDYDYSSSVEVSGVMDLKPGEHLLYLSPPDDDSVALGCIFDGTNNEYCKGQIMRERTREICGEFFMTRIDNH